MSSRPPVITFGPYEADLHTRQLRRDGVLVPLQQQPFMILAALLQSPGELVSRDRLRQLIWPEGTFVDFERGLTSAIRKVREALDDGAGAPVYIETLKGRGYRFVAAVGVIDRTVADGRGQNRWIAQMAAVLVIGLFEGGFGPNTMASERLAAAGQLSDYACLLKSQGRFEEGLAAIERAHAIAPESARFTAEVGLHLHAVRRYEDEMAMLLQAVRQDGQSADAWLHLGLGYARRARFDQAVPALERAQRISTANPRSRHWLEWARAQQHAANGSVTSS